MAAHFKIQTQRTKSKRHRGREKIISASATATLTSDSSCDSSSTGYLICNHHQQRKIVPPIIVSTDNSSWCCSASKPPPPPPRPPPPPSYTTHPTVSNPESISLTVTNHYSPFLSSSPLTSDPPSNLKNRYSLDTVPQVMAPNTTKTVYGDATHDSFPSSFSKFNCALTAGLLTLSPPPSIDKPGSSPTLFEMMASELDCHPRAQIPTNNVVVSSPKSQIPIQDKKTLMQQRLLDLLACRSPGNQFNDPTSSDVRITLSSKEGLNVSMNVHRQILVAHSRFFAVKLYDRWSTLQRTSNPYVVEIANCDDIEVYIETLRLMYCKDLRKKLMKENVSRVLGMLKVSAAIEFDAGVLSCLEYLEAAPWTEDEEEKVASLLSVLQLEGVGASEVLKRVSVDVTAGVEDGNDNEEVLLKLLQVVLEGKDEKARREMKGLVLKMLRENSHQNYLRKESLYSAWDGCLQLLRHYFFQAAAADLRDVGHIARQADNLHWILDIMIDRQIAEDFLTTWASQSDLSDAHSKVPAIHRYEISRVTARLFVGIGKGQLLASKDAKCLLVQTWLVPFYEDFRWMRRASKGLDHHLIEDGLSNTILTLPLAWQQKILMSWFERFLNLGDDCPNIQRGFEVWWRRAFWRQNGEPELPRHMQITTAIIENS